MFMEMNDADGVQKNLHISLLQNYKNGGSKFYFEATRIIQ
jgi:hypothetical protein